MKQTNDGPLAPSPAPCSCNLSHDIALYIHLSPRVLYTPFPTGHIYLFLNTSSNIYSLFYFYIFLSPRDKLYFYFFGFLLWRATLFIEIVIITEYTSFYIGYIHDSGISLWFDFVHTIRFDSVSFHSLFIFTFFYFIYFYFFGSLRFWLDFPCRIWMSM